MPIESIPVYYRDDMTAYSGGYSPSAAKPPLVVAAWRKLGTRVEVRSPDPVPRTALYRTHDRAFVDAVLDGEAANGFGNRRADVARSLPFTSGAMLAAARAAISNRQVAVAPVSGFHHAGYDHPQGFCTFNGLMVTAQTLLEEEAARRVGILDFDMHYGNGTDELIGHHGLASRITHFTAGAKYHRPSQATEFLSRIPDLIRLFDDCDVLLYQAGADPHIDDPLGGWLTSEQLRVRDHTVFRCAAHSGSPVAWNLAGGYQSPVAKVVAVHQSTMEVCVEVHCAGRDGAVHSL